MSNLFGAVNDQDQSLQSRGSGKFGLNTGARITKIEYNPNGGKDGAELDAFDITVSVSDREYRNRLFDVTSIYDRDQGAPRELDLTNEADKAEYAKAIGQVQGVITHAVKATGVTQEQITEAFTNPAKDFVEWGKIMVSLVPSDYDSKPVDVFLEYQWSIKEGNDQTYLTLPKNMKGGYFLCPSVSPQEGSWEAVNDSNGLRYVDGAGNEHPFTRKENYMDSPKANQQGGDESDQTTAATSNMGGASKPKAIW
jgi:hypothetical protein